jgi:hypothetical protein
MAYSCTTKCAFHRRIIIEGIPLNLGVLFIAKLQARNDGSSGAGAHKKKLESVIPRILTIYETLRVPERNPVACTCTTKCAFHGWIVIEGIPLRLALFFVVIVNARNDG